MTYFGIFFYIHLNIIILKLNFSNVLMKDNKKILKNFFKKVMKKQWFKRSMCGS
jgi:hypothetical protein